MDYDEKILECIKDKYKSVKEISEETNIPYNRVSIRMRALKKHDVITMIQGAKQNVGVPPSKYKKN